MLRLLSSSLLHFKRTCGLLSCVVLLVSSYLSNLLPKSRIKVGPTKEMILYSKHSHENIHLVEILRKNFSIIKKAKPMHYSTCLRAVKI